MSVYLLDGSVLLEGGSVATSEDCCCGQDCTTCDDLPPSGLPPPSHLNVVIELSGSCSSMEFSGSIMYDRDLSFSLTGPIAGHFFCLHHILDHSFLGDWTGQFTKTCTLDSSVQHWGSDGTNGFIGRDTITCEWWFQLDIYPAITQAIPIGIGACSGCSLSDLTDPIFEVFAPPGDPSGVYVFVLTDTGVTLTVTVTIT